MSLIIEEVNHKINKNETKPGLIREHQTDGLFSKIISTHFLIDLDELCLAS